MIETFIIALFTLLIALYVQARRAAREIREIALQLPQFRDFVPHRVQMVDGGSSNAAPFSDSSFKREMTA